MNNRKSIFFSSDWHLGHENVLKYDQRPFKDLNHMHEVLVNNYNSIVSDDDICYFLGDIGFFGKEVVRKIISRLNGTKVCILGNHDKGINSVHTSGFDVVLYGAKMVIADNLVTLSRCPLLGVFRENVDPTKGSKPGENWHGETRHARHSFKDFGQFHLHGHTHKKPEE